MAELGVPRRSHTHPIRTCVGCRRKAPQAELLRVVGGRGSTASSVVPDPDHQQPGRGAYLHPTSTCLESAVQRRALSRALRVPEPVDVSEVAHQIEAQQQAQQQDPTQ